MNRVRSTFWLVSFAACLGLAAGVTVDRDQVRLGSLSGSPCLVREIVGLDCPGCGLTRSTALVVQRRFDEAWSVHPGGFAVVVFCVLGIGVQGAALRYGERGSRGRRRLTRRGSLALGFAVVLAWLNSVVFAVVSRS